MRSLKQLVAVKGSVPGELIIDQPVEIAGSDIVKIPKNLSVRVAHTGKIVVTNITQSSLVPQLDIEGSFEAGLYPVFQFDQNSKDEYPVLFRTGSVKEVLACWFGALPDVAGQSNSQLAIQRTVYAASEVARIYLPAGDYWLDDTIHLEHPGRNGFISYVLEGGRPAMGASNRPTRLNARFRDRPVINLAGVRDAQIKNISILGLNKKASEVYKPVGEVLHADEERCYDTVDTFRPAYWISDGCTSGRHNPYCAISTDAYGREPGVIKTYYPDRARYVPREKSSSGSAQILIEGVEIQQFVVGIAISPAGAPQNDMIRIQRSAIKSCTYGVAVGTTQARGLHIQDNWLTQCYAAIDNVSFGEEIRAGSKLNCTSNIYSKCRNLYLVSSRANGAAHFSGEYAENFIQLGHMGLGGNVGTSGSNAVFTGCDYAFGTRVKTMRLFATYGTTTFVGCDFRLYGDEERSKDFYFTLDSNSSNLVFQSCSFQVNCKDEFSRFFLSQYAEWHRVHFRDCTLKRVKGINTLGCGIRNLSDPVLPEKTDISEAWLSLSDDQVVDLDNRVEAYRCPLHLNSQTLRARSTARPYQFFHLKYTAAAQPFAAVDGPIRKINAYSVSFEQKYVGSFWVDDRIYCAFYLEEYPHQNSQLEPTNSEHTFPALNLPLLEVISVEGKTVTAQIPSGLQQEVKLPSDFKLDQAYVAVLPRVKNSPYVMINDGCLGQFAQQDTVVRKVTNIEQLELGDLVNGEFVEVGTRIVEKDDSAKTIRLSRPAVKASPANTPVNIPMVIAKEV